MLSVQQQIVRYPRSTADRIYVDFLSSGSKGNCTLLRHGDQVVAVDMGISPNQMNQYLHDFSGDAKNIKLSAVFVSHLHSDHLYRGALSFFLRNKTKLFVHIDHVPTLEEMGSDIVAAMRSAGLLHAYTSAAFQPFENLQILPLPVPHDSAGTHGFVFHYLQGAVRVGYATDLGYMPEEHHACLSNCDVLALEFNHDPVMQRSSNRPKYLINRVLGNYGHLSNAQAGAALARILRLPAHRTLRHLALMHMSTDCNTPELALETAQRIIGEQDAHQPGIVLTEQSRYVGSVSVPIPSDAMAAHR